MLLSCWALLPYRHSFPTRRSSDLTVVRRTADAAGSGVTVGAGAPAGAPATRRRLRPLVSSEPGGISCEESGSGVRSEEHTSELQSRGHLVCRLLLAKKKARQTWRD